MNKAMIKKIRVVTLLPALSAWICFPAVLPAREADNQETAEHSITMPAMGAPGTTGTLKWQKQFAGTIYSAPAIGADGKIYLGLPDGSLCAFNPDGSTSRVWNTDAPIYSDPVIAADGTIYLGSLDSKLYGFNPDGTTSHVWQTGAAIFETCAIGPDGTIYTSSSDHNLYGFNPDGTTGHVWTTQNEIRSAPVVGFNGLIYIGSTDSNFYGFNPDGTTSHVWQVDDIIQYSSPAIDTNGNIYIATMGGSLYAFNPDGTTNHVWNPSAPIISAPVIGADGKIYQGVSDGQLMAFNPDGTTGQVWNAGAIYSAPLLGSDGSVYASGDMLYSFKPDGTTNWSYPLTAWAYGGPSLDTNGVLYFVAYSNFNAIYATGSLARAVWPKCAHDLKNTGALPPLPPTNVVAMDGLYNDRVALNWTPVNYASSYDILRGTTDNMALAQICAEAVPGTNYADTTAAASITYYYWVFSRNNSGAGVLPSAADTGWRHCFVSGAAGDYDADGLADPAVYNFTNGNWKVKFSSGNYVLAIAENLLGGAGYTAVTADFDGDAKADPAVYEEATGTWIVKLSSGNYAPLTLTGFLGAQGYSALAADFDGDKFADPAVYHEATGDWTFNLFCPLSGQTYCVVIQGLIGGQGWYPVMADFDGDAYADPGVYNEATGNWAVLLSSAGYYCISLEGLLGGTGFKPVPADYDRDGLADPAIYNPVTGDWKVKFSTANYCLVETSGLLAP